MKFTLTGHHRSSTRNTPLSIENLIISGAYPEIFTTNSILKSRTVKDGDKIILESLWSYQIFYKDVEVYYFDSLLDIEITEENIEVTDKQCFELIEYTHNKLKKEWDIRKTTEVNFFPSVLDLPTDKIHFVVEDLKKTLFSELRLKTRG